MFLIVGPRTHRDWTVICIFALFEEFNIYTAISVVLACVPLLIMLYSLYRGVEDSNLCMDCQQCVAVCPVRRAKKDYFGPRGVMIAARSGNKTQALDGNIFSCTSCMACVEACPRGLNVKHVMDRVRFLMAEEDMGQYPAHKYIINMAKTHGNVYEEKPKFKPDIKTQKEGIIDTLNNYSKIGRRKNFEIKKPGGSDDAGKDS